MRIFRIGILTVAIGLAGCVSTPQTASDADTVALSQTQTDLRDASRLLRDQYREAGWSASRNGGIGQFANMLLNGRDETADTLSPAESYLARIAPDGAEPQAVFVAIDTDLSTAASLAGTVAVHARGVANGSGVDSLGRDLEATEETIAAVSRAIEFFSSAIEGVSGRVSDVQLETLNERHDRLRTEFDRLSEAADGIADRRRDARNGIFS